MTRHYYTIYRNAYYYRRPMRAVSLMLIGLALGLAVVIGAVAAGAALALLG